VATGLGARPRAYRRTRGSRATAVFGVLLFGGIFLFQAIAPPAPGALRGFLICGALLALSALLALINFGDRIVVEEEGVRFRNVWRERLRLGGSRLLRWGDVQEVRQLGGGAARPLSSGPAYVVRTRAGRRYVLDSIEGVEEIAGLLGERAARPGADPGASG